MLWCDNCSEISQTVLLYRVGCLDRCFVFVLLLSHKENYKWLCSESGCGLSLMVNDDIIMNHFPLCMNGFYHSSINIHQQCMVLLSRLYQFCLKVSFGNIFIYILMLLTVKKNPSDTVRARSNSNSITPWSECQCYNSITYSYITTTFPTCRPMKCSAVIRMLAWDRLFVCS